MIKHTSQFGRVVKAVDLKSTGFTRAGSNPAADDFYFFFLDDAKLLILIII